MKICQDLVGLLGKKALENRQGFSHFMLLLLFFLLAMLDLEYPVPSGENRKLGGGRAT